MLLDLVVTKGAEGVGFSFDEFDGQLRIVDVFDSTLNIKPGEYADFWSLDRGSNADCMFYERTTDGPIDHLPTRRGGRARVAAQLFQSDFLPDVFF